MRRLPPVSSPVRPAALVRAAGAAVRGGAVAARAVRADLTARYGAHAVALTDSGTSALVLALRALVGTGGTVAYPAYACVDLAAAARFASVRVRLYDLDPATLSPDLASLEQTLRRGVDAVLVAHLYGFPVDVPGVRALVAGYGIPVIEDAAQAAGGSLHGTMLGGFGPLSILSFGRGKGTTGGNGGALLATDPAHAETVAAAARRLGEHPSGWRDVAAAAAQWAVGRPSLYGVPTRIPTLRLGEMVYHEAHEPRSISAGAVTLVRSALRQSAGETAVRRRNALALVRRHAAAFPTAGGSVRIVQPIEGGDAGYLRLPVLDPTGRPPDADLGIVGGYPRTLFEQRELHPCLHAGEAEHPGALELRRSLVTLPVHGMVTARDLDRLAGWLEARAAHTSGDHRDGAAVSSLMSARQ